MGATDLEVRDSYEERRGCGYRRPGLYLVGAWAADTCSLLPHPLHTCRACGGGIKPARGWTWVEPDSLLAGLHRLHGTPEHAATCPLVEPGLLGLRAGLLWVGEGFYATTGAFIAEAVRMGVSRRIPAIPRGFTAGRDWVLLGHRAACTTYTDDDAWTEPGIFLVWRPTAVEYVVDPTDSREQLERMAARGCQLVRVHRLDEQQPIPDLEG